MTGKQEIFNGIPIYVPNNIINDTKDFYISYNNYDISTYGSDTTALVKNDLSDFWILNGNHTKQYNQIIKEGGNFKDCFKYFKDNIVLINKLSDKLNEKIVVNKDGSLKVVDRKL